MLEHKLHNCSFKGLSQSYAWEQALALLKPYNTASDDFCVNPGIQLTFGNVTNLFTILIPPLYYTNSRRPFPTRWQTRAIAEFIWLVLSQF